MADEQSERRYQILENVLLGLGPLTLIGGLAYYFSEVRLRAFCGYFGIDSSRLDVSVRDSAVRAVEILFQPGAVLVGVAAFALLLHFYVVAPRLRRTSPRSIRYRAIVVGAFAASGTLFIFAGLSLGVVPDRGVFPPAAAATALVVAPALAEYGMHLMELRQRRLRSRRARRRNVPARPLVPHRVEYIRRALMALLAVIGMFWATAVIADDQGRRLAMDFKEGLSTRNEIVLYVEKPLALATEDMPGVRETQIPGEGEWKFRYTGFRILFRSGGIYYLIPRCWEPKVTVLALPEDHSSQRLDSRRGANTDSCPARKQQEAQ